MPKIAYVIRKFRTGTQALIDRANVILEEYAVQGFVLTVRQLYYQFVARGYLANNERMYQKIIAVTSDARLAGLLDWNYLEDRTRYLRDLPHWESPKSLLSAITDQYRIRKWDKQPYYPEVWIEKDALVGVIAAVCEANDVPYFACRGYDSLSELWVAAERLRARNTLGQVPILFHLGDHDPSGIDMSRDIQDRLATFGVFPEFQRLALNMDQVQQYAPPPNPAKQSDSRFQRYADQYGNESWELDALEPSVIVALIQDALDNIRDQNAWDAAIEQEDKARGQLGQVYGRWQEVVDFLNS